MTGDDQGMTQRRVEQVRQPALALRGYAAHLLGDIALPILALTAPIADEQKRERYRPRDRTARSKYQRQSRSSGQQLTSRDYAAHPHSPKMRAIPKANWPLRPRLPSPLRGLQGDRIERRNDRNFPAYP